MGVDYPVNLGGEPVGKVQVSRQGLYYHFFCRCRIQSSNMYRLEVVCGDTRENLGTLIRMEDGFGLETKVPIRRFGQGNMEFHLLAKHDALSGSKFVPISPEEPFSYLSRLKDAFLTIQDGTVGISFQESRTAE